ncbi:MAG TPA: hypothetical protein VFP32_00570 [Candidatus Saccharimonadales bacterium]|nr:hypothetical protein [Candidatus Saccharimonadales bacterium]
MINDKFVILGFLIQLGGLLIYVKETLAGRAKPNRVSWFLWFLAPMIAFAAELDKGVGLQALMTFSVGFGPAMVLLASFYSKKAYWKLKTTDYLCGLLSLLGLALWLIFNQGNLAIALSIAADLAAGAPTLVKSYYHPETESAAAYTVAIVNSGITLLTIKVWSLANYGFPIYIFIINITFVILIKYKFGLRLQTSVK